MFIYASFKLWAFEPLKGKSCNTFLCNGFIPYLFFFNHKLACPGLRRILFLSDYIKPITDDIEDTCHLKKKKKEFSKKRNVIFTYQKIKNKNWGHLSVMKFGLPDNCCHTLLSPVPNTWHL